MQCNLIVESLTISHEILLRLYHIIRAEIQFQEPFALLFEVIFRLLDGHHSAYLTYVLVKIDISVPMSPQKVSALLALSSFVFYIKVSVLSPQKTRLTRAVFHRHSESYVDQAKITEQQVW
jgi:hypothetical protein